MPGPEWEKQCVFKPHLGDALRRYADKSTVKWLDSDYSPPPKCVDQPEHVHFLFDVDAKPLRRDVLAPPQQLGRLQRPGSNDSPPAT